MTDRKEFSAKTKVAHILQCSHCRMDLERAYRVSAQRLSRPQFCSKECRKAACNQFAADYVMKRIWDKVDRSAGPDECWPWTGRLDPQGYGRLDVLGKPALAHRIAFTSSKGNIAPSMCVCHRCDNPQCCNPLHLFLGSQTDNVADCIAKGRFHPGLRRGEACNKSKLTVEQVREIFRSSETGRQLGQRFGISATAINKIKAGKHWAHVTGVA